MIRQLPEPPCWYVDSDPWDEWDEPHFPTEAAAQAWETDAAAIDEVSPRPVLRKPVPCWVAECDRCMRPLDDEDDTSREAHCHSERQLTARLDAAGWRVVPGGLLCCPECATARPAMAEVQRVAVTVRVAGQTRQTMGERTACPQLVVTVLRDAPRGRWLGVVLTHRATGRYLPLNAWTSDVGVLHRVAELLAHLDWSPTEPAHYATGYPEQLRAAVNQATTERTQAATAAAAAAAHQQAELEGRGR